MKKLVALLALFAAGSFTFAAEPSKAPTPTKSKTDPKADLELCCDDDAKPADTKTAKATEQKSDAAKKDAPTPVAKSDKK